MCSVPFAPAALHRCRRVASDAVTRRLERRRRRGRRCPHGCPCEAEGVIPPVDVAPCPVTKRDERHMPSSACNEKLIRNVADLRSKERANKEVAAGEGIDVEQDSQRRVGRLRVAIVHRVDTAVHASRREGTAAEASPGLTRHHRCGVVRGEKDARDTVALAHGVGCVTVCTERAAADASLAHARISRALVTSTDVHANRRLMGAVDAPAQCSVPPVAKVGRDVRQQPKYECHPLRVEPEATAPVMHLTAVAHLVGVLRASPPHVGRFEDGGELAAVVTKWLFVERAGEPAVGDHRLEEALE
mmetsp:Transcript_63428/g.141433  ORF Transcript_63428/g.141433 Transcript_63428/m.141433 type:complete len:302 (+) Transcript_63428:939-1844(+)